jgi:hypothetical protein
MLGHITAADDECAPGFSRTPASERLRVLAPFRAATRTHAHAHERYVQRRTLSAQLQYTGAQQLLHKHAVLT